CTFHRAFDLVSDFSEALETIIGLGFERILTSGGAKTAIDGHEVIKKLVTQAAGRIIIMPGAGINPENIALLRELTGANEFHSTAKRTVVSKMQHVNKIASTGSLDDYTYNKTCSKIVSALVTALNLTKDKH
ncbi:MAG: copper homeostasis protein CutC, partial [Pedobacter sp.]